MKKSVARFIGMLMVSLLIIGGQAVATSETQFDFSSYGRYSKSIDEMDDLAMFIYKINDTFSDYITVSVTLPDEPITMLLPSLYVRNYKQDDCVASFGLAFAVDSTSNNTIESILLKIDDQKTRLFGVQSVGHSNCYICFSPDSYDFLEELLKQEKILGRLEGTSFNIDFEIGTSNTKLIKAEYDRFVSSGGLSYAQNEFDDFSVILTPVN